MMITVDPTTVRDMIAARHHGATTALGSGDLDALMPVYADDIVMMPPNQPARVGRSAVREMWEELLKLYSVQVIVAVEEVEIAGDWAFERGTFEMTLAAKAGGASIADKGKYLDVLRRQADGAWKYCRICFNSDRPAGA